MKINCWEPTAKLRDSAIQRSQFHTGLRSIAVHGSQVDARLSVKSIYIEKRKVLGPDDTLRVNRLGAPDHEGDDEDEECEEEEIKDAQGYSSEEPSMIWVETVITESVGQVARTESFQMSVVKMHPNLTCCFML